jgi:hypothetical protein
MGGELGDHVGPFRVLRIAGAFPEEQAFADALVGFGKSGVARQLLGVDDGQVQAGLDAMVQEDGVEDLAPGGGQAKETLEIPRMVLQRGRAALMARTPSMVSAAEPK